ncbi:MAG: hypothetical protein WC551_10215 [Patescibacteria group bacterium]|jgi:hypothetical protein
MSGFKNPDGVTCCRQCDYFQTPGGIPDCPLANGRNHDAPMLNGSGEKMCFPKKRIPHPLLRHYYEPE